MFSPSALVNKIQSRGGDLYTGVPCSYLTSLINYVAADDAVDYVRLNNEGEAVAFAAGAFLAGKRPVVMFQNSGLGNIVNPITSLAHPFRIPLLLICSWRGQPGIKDEPQHELMGSVLTNLLSTIGVESLTLSGHEDQMLSAVDEALDILERTSRPAALIVPKGTFQSESSALDIVRTSPIKGTVRQSTDVPAVLRRFDALQLICSVVGTAHVIVGTTGKTSRELLVCRDSPNHFYMIGAMGCASSLALGIAMHLPPEKKVVVVDGDGAALMRLEAMVSIGYHAPANLIHVLLDNNVHDSTGGQQTLSDGLSFDCLANACGYSNAVSVASKEHLENELNYAMSVAGPSFVHTRIVSGSLENLPRPSISPPDAKDRFMNYLRGR